MNQIDIGNFIAKKRKENNLTQAELAEKIGVSNKTVSKWETGKNMPDYSIIQDLCSELNISISELMDAEERDFHSIRVYDDKQILELIEKTQSLEKQKEMLLGFVLMALGNSTLAFRFAISGGWRFDFLFIFGVITALVSSVVGIYFVIRSFILSKE